MKSISPRFGTLRRRFGTLSLLNLKGICPSQHGGSLHSPFRRSSSAARRAAQVPLVHLPQQAIWIVGAFALSANTPRLGLCSRLRRWRHPPGEGPLGDLLAQRIVHQPGGASLPLLRPAYCAASSTAVPSGPGWGIVRSTSSEVRPRGAPARGHLPAVSFSVLQG